ncbi:iron-containing alcohol dehydrogenase [Rhizobium sp. SGZ-381]|uniref:iron-containing alcohol dehydrogenase n=1 Tax=Rhizobium sp. SGZ-381 TaxID=3342800 RepID=UPI00366BAADD
MRFSTAFIPDIHFGAGAVGEVAMLARALGPVECALLVLDGFLAQGGLAEALVADLSSVGIRSRIFSEFSGEPKLSHLRAAVAAAEGCQLVIGIGGGSALDIAKITACCAASGKDPLHYALAANPLPKNPLRKILVPTTAGTGSETSATTIFTGETGKKLWIWGPETKADQVILDPQLTVTLPPSLTAWCGMDAFIHAFEAATNRNAHAGAALYAHQAMRLIIDGLPVAVADPGNLPAREKLLLGSCYAGIAIDNCGTAIAHNMSHALAGLAPVHHGLATALAFEATLPWLVQTETPDLQAAARACGLEQIQDLPAFISDLMDRCGIRRALPAAFAAFTAADLAAEMKAPENQPMRRATIFEVTDADLDRFAESLMALPRTL